MQHPLIGGGRDAPESAAGGLEQARAQEYRLLAALLTRAPSQSLLDELARLPGDDTPLGRAHRALARAAQVTLHDAAASEYFNLFVGVGRGDVLPYASFYKTGFLNSRPLAEVRDGMARLGFARANGVFEPEDHIGSLFEIMGHLIAAEDTDAAVSFFKQHIAGWSERLFADVEASPSAIFYRAVADLGRLWIEIETEALALPA